jgi:hypothetical protein
VSVGTDGSSAIQTYLKFLMFKNVYGDFNFLTLEAKFCNSKFKKQTQGRWGSYYAVSGIFSRIPRK